MEVEDGEDKESAAEEQQEEAIEDQGHTFTCICILQQHKMSSLEGHKFRGSMFKQNMLNKPNLDFSFSYTSRQ